MKFAEISLSIILSLSCSICFADRKPLKPMNIASYKMKKLTISKKPSTHPTQSHKKREVVRTAPPGMRPVTIDFTENEKKTAEDHESQSDELREARVLHAKNQSGDVSAYFYMDDENNFEKTNQIKKTDDLNSQPSLENSVSVKEIE
jgi:hypothetical protein